MQFTCNGLFLHYFIGTVIKVKDVNTSSAALKVSRVIFIQKPVVYNNCSYGTKA